MSTKESSWLFYPRIFDNFILANRLLAKDLRRSEACPSVNNNLCENLSHDQYYQWYLMII